MFRLDSYTNFSTVKCSAFRCSTTHLFSITLLFYILYKHSLWCGTKLKLLRMQRVELIEKKERNLSGKWRPSGDELILARVQRRVPPIPVIHGSGSQRAALSCRSSRHSEIECVYGFYPPHLPPYLVRTKGDAALYVWRSRSWAKNSQMWAKCLFWRAKFLNKDKSHVAMQRLKLFTL